MRTTYWEFNMLILSSSLFIICNDPIFRAMTIGKPNQVKELESNGTWVGGELS